MAQEKVTLSNIDGGQLLAEANRALEGMIRDMIERGDVLSPRRVTIQVVIEPDLHETPNGMVNWPNLKYRVDCKIPAHAIRETKGFIGVTEDGEETLLVNVDLPEERDPRQQNIFDLEKARGGESQ